MKAKLLIAMLLPLPAVAQEVRPVISNDYLALIQKGKDTSSKKTTDSSNSMRNAVMLFRGSYFNADYTVKKFNAGDTQLITLRYPTLKTIGITGSYSATLERQQVNRLPAVQNEYVQGRSVNGQLSWQGPETGELFSYGPSVHTLEFDGNGYAYDRNGKLVTKGTGNGTVVTPYDNSIFRPATLLSHAFILNAKYKENYTQLASLYLKAGQSREQTFIRHNNNKTDNFSAAVETTLGKATISSSYNFRQERFTHSNRNGFLNRAYQNSLLSPVSFDSRQGSQVAGLQRSYSPHADNSFFLLEDKSHSFLQQQQTGSLAAERKFSRVHIRLTQSLEKVRQQSNEGYRASTAFFPDGVAVRRNAQDNNYSLAANMKYMIPDLGDKLKAETGLNYVYSDNNSSIQYASSGSAWNYRRSAHDVALSFSPEWHGGNTRAGLVLTDKIYLSATSRRNAWLLPGISGYLRFDDRLTTKLFGSFNRFNSERPVNRSLAGSNSINYKVQEAGQYLPVTEVNGFGNLSPTEHREFTAGIDIWSRSISFIATWFNRNTANEVFPIVQGGQLHLANMASHRNRGFELQLDLYNRLMKQNELFLRNSISFIAYRSKVTKVRAGYNYAPVAGFSDVHKAVVQGEPLGVIMGNRWQRDASNNIVIGADGFPLVNPTLSVIGNPVPDFTMKMSNYISYKNNLSFSVDIEWRNGGDIWNGTQSLLDYYGRSALSGSQRSVTGYTFPGVQQNGSHNTIPVNFYDRALPVQQNRWVRYGTAGVAESYIQKGSCVRINNMSLSWKSYMKKRLQYMSFSLYAGNVMIWSAYDGVDPSQLLYDQPGSSGLDFFNSFHPFLWFYHVTSILIV